MNLPTEPILRVILETIALLGPVIAIYFTCENVWENRSQELQYALYKTIANEHSSKYLEDYLSEFLSYYTRWRDLDKYRLDKSTVAPILLLLGVCFIFWKGYKWNMWQTRLVSEQEIEIVLIIISLVVILLVILLLYGSIYGGKATVSLYTLFKPAKAKEENEIDWAKVLSELRFSNE